MVDVQRRRHRAVPADRVRLQRADRPLTLRRVSTAVGRHHFDQIVFRVVPENATRRQLLERARPTPLDLQPDPGRRRGAARATSNLQVLDLRHDPRQLGDHERAAAADAGSPPGFLLRLPLRRGASTASTRGCSSAPVRSPTRVRGYDPDVFLYQTDLAKAKELILAGGFDEGDTFDYVFDAGDEPGADRRPALPGQRAADRLQPGDRSRVDDATIETIVFGDAPAEERPHFIGWGWWPDYNDPWNQLAPELHSSRGDRRRRHQRRRLGQRPLRGDHGRGRALHRRDPPDRADEGSAEHPDRAGPAGHLLRPGRSTTRPRRATSRASSPTRSTSTYPFYDLSSEHVAERPSAVGADDASTRLADRPTAHEEMA